jgi:hypothetical protein
MLEIGDREEVLRLNADGKQIAGIARSVMHNKLILLHGGDAPLDIDNANEIKQIETVPFARWRVIALGIYWVEASTADEDPIIHFGRVGDVDAYGIIGSAITGGEKFNIADFQKYDPKGILADEVIAETSATLVITWTPGAEFNVWNVKAYDLQVAEAAAAGMTSGKVRPFVVIEIDSGGLY